MSASLNDKAVGFTGIVLEGEVGCIGLSSGALTLRQVKTQAVYVDPRLGELGKVLVGVRRG